MAHAPQPPLFVPHGAPTFALHPGAAGAALAPYAAQLSRPRAIVAISAHWDTALPTVGLATRLDTIHDFHGFPRATRSHPTAEHLLPLHVALGAVGEQFTAARPHTGIDDYVLAMDAYAFSNPSPYVSQELS